MEIKSDIQIAQEVEMANIREIAEAAGIDEKYVEQYGNYKAKIDYNLLQEKQDAPDGRPGAGDDVGTGYPGFSCGAGACGARVRRNFCAVVSGA